MSGRHSRSIKATSGSTDNRKAETTFDVSARVRVSAVPFFGKVGSQRASEAISFLREDGVPRRNERSEVTAI